MQLDLQKYPTYAEIKKKSIGSTNKSEFIYKIYNNYK